MDNKILFGVMCIIFNAIGVPCFMQGRKDLGIKRIFLGIVTFGVIFVINEIYGIILGVKVLTMSDEEFNQCKNDLVMGVPKLKLEGEKEKTGEQE